MILDSMKSCRRFFHQIPEPGWMEYRTTINIINILKDMGYDVMYGKSIHGGPRMGLPPEEKISKYKEGLTFDADFDVSEILEGYTGALVKLDTKKKGPTIGLRFDIDALEIPESDDPSHIPTKENFKSTIPGAMHACGHDGHITIGLFIAKWLMENKDNLTGKYILTFQPAEEGVRGAKSMVNSGNYEDIDYFLGLHIGINLPSGSIGVGSENIFATSKLDIQYHGVSAHAGALPEEGKNALLGAASCALNLHTLPQHSGGMSRINVGVLKAGTGRNVIPDTATLQVEVRGENDTIVSYLVERAKEIAKGSAIQYGLDYSVEEVGSALALEHHDFEFYSEMETFLESKGFNVIRDNKFNASEDVTYYMNKVIKDGGKAIHFLIGSDLKAGHHNEKFDFNEDDLERSFEVLKDTILYLNER